MTKLDDEMAAAKTSIRNFFGEWKDNIVCMAPRWLVNLINAIIRHPGTPWFFLGSAVEAIGLVVQFQFIGVSYPIWDFVGGVIMFLVIAMLQRKPEYAPVTDDEEEGDDANDNSEN
jgi:hypothetical protein